MTFGLSLSRTGASRFSPSLAFKANAVMTISTVIIANLWAQWTNFGLPESDYILGLSIMLGILGVGGCFYTFIRPRADFASAIFNFMLLQLFLFYSGILSYLGTRASLPEVDHQLAAWDKALGLDWPGFVYWAASQPLICDWAVIVYDKPFFVLPFMIMALLVLTKKAHRFEELVSFTLITMLITLIIGTLMPAGSPYAYHGISVDITAKFHAIADATYNNFFYQVRSGQIRAMDMENRQGLIAFPSYHTVVALMLTLYVRDFAGSIGPMALVSLGIILATPLIGGHYFVDILGGIVVAMVAFWLARGLQRMDKREAALERFPT